VLLLLTRRAEQECLKPEHLALFFERALWGREHDHGQKQQQEQQEQQEQPQQEQEEHPSRREAFAANVAKSQVKST